MSNAIEKLAPQAVVLAIALYWSWPTLGTFLPSASESGISKKETKKTGGAREFAAASLAPKFPPPPKRNPFLATDANPSATVKARKSGAKGANAMANADAKDLGLVLNATCIVGDHRLAIISGNIYREKEMVQASENGPAGCIVSEIHPHNVLLLSQGNLMQLNYPDTAAKPNAGRGLANKPVK